MATDPEFRQPNDWNSAVRVLEHGEFRAMRLVPYGSNQTLDSIIVGKGAFAVRAIYKPMQGETPLWDFPYNTLYKREYAAFLLSETLAWNIVPYTLIREGPYGIGTVQLFIEHDPQDHFFTLRSEYPDVFRRFAVFDIISNNADRKSTHCLLDPQHKMWSIDHGITFNLEDKLRTVIWDYAGEQMPEAVLEDLVKLDAELRGAGPFARALYGLLNKDEVAALCARVQAVLEDPVFPHPSPYRRSYPWPMV